MAVGVTEIKTVGRLIFDLERGEEKTTRTLDIPYPKTEDENLQTYVNETNAVFSSNTNLMNTFIQPANWRDTNVIENQWMTTRVSYEIVTTSTTPITPESSNG